MAKCHHTITIQCGAVDNEQKEPQPRQQRLPSSSMPLQTDDWMTLHQQTNMYIYPHVNTCIHTWVICAVGRQYRIVFKRCVCENVCVTVRNAKSRWHGTNKCRIGYISQHNSFRRIFPCVLAANTTTTPSLCYDKAKANKMSMLSRKSAKRQNDTDIVVFDHYNVTLLHTSYVCAAVSCLTLRVLFAQRDPSKASQKQRDIRRRRCQKVLHARRDVWTRVLAVSP